MTQRYFFSGYSWSRAAVLVTLALLSAVAQAANEAGTVSFVIGNATRIDSAGKSSSVLRGEKISAGETLVTGDSGHIHLTMVDKAFLSVRPKSRLKIQDYHYDPAVPANNRIKFVLEQGVARSITGRAGEASRENYRLNTPLAAIGIRGTDFVVLASAEVTRVYVQNGAVVVAPFGNACLPSAFGPCAERMSVLTAAMSNAYLELRSRTSAPVLVYGEKSPEAPNTVAPPRAEEPRVVAPEKPAKPTASFDSNEAVRNVAVDSIKTRVEVIATPAAPAAPVVGAPPVLVETPPVVVELPPVEPVVVAPPPVVIPPPVVVPPTVVTPPPPAKFWWGRWSVEPGDEARGVAASANDTSREVGGGNDLFGLFREVGPVSMPGSGIAKFALADSEAYFVNGTQILSAATVSSPSLTVDFGARRYETALTVNASGYTSVPVTSSGRVSFLGELRSESGAATSLNGWLSRDTSQAGYVFERVVPGSTSVTGATRWTR